MSVNRPSEGGETDEIFKQLQMKLRAASYTAHGPDWPRLFQYYDRDNSGALNLEEFRSCLR